MPRSVNNVASKARRKKIMQMAKGYFGRRKNVWTVAKNAVEKAFNMPTETDGTKKEIFVLFGLPGLMPVPGIMDYPTVN
jgi:large subunit ribosomal protein L20